MLNTRTVEKSFSVAFTFLIKAEENPPLTIVSDSAMNTLRRAIKPKSEGSSNRAKTIDITTLIRFSPTVSILVQINPPMVFCLMLVKIPLFIWTHMD
jgi:hypothetical protein